MSSSYLEGKDRLRRGRGSSSLAQRVATSWPPRAPAPPRPSGTRPWPASRPRPPRCCCRRRRPPTSAARFGIRSTFPESVSVARAGAVSESSGRRRRRWRTAFRGLGARSKRGGRRHWPRARPRGALIGRFGDGTPFLITPVPFFPEFVCSQRGRAGRGLMNKSPLSSREILRLTRNIAEGGRGEERESSMGIFRATGQKW